MINIIGNIRLPDKELLTEFRSLKKTIFEKNNSDEQSTNSEDAGLQPKGIIGSSRNDEITNVLRANGQGDSGALRGSQSGKSEQERQLKKNNNGIPEPVSQGEYGTENEEDSRLKEFSDYLRDSYAAAEAKGTNDSAADKREVELRITLQYAKENGLWLSFSKATSLGEIFPSETKMMFSTTIKLDVRAERPAAPL